jgi:hypothetical protein
VTEIWDTDYVYNNDLPETFGRLLCAYLQPLMKSVSHPDSFITAIHDESEGLTLCERLS